MTVPEIAKVKVWPSEELNGIVFVWYHCDDIEPHWRIPKIVDIGNATFHYRGRVEHHVNTHIQVSFVYHCANTLEALKT